MVSFFSYLPFLFGYEAIPLVIQLNRYWHAWPTGVFRTDQSGTVEIASDGTRLWVKTEH